MKAQVSLDFILTITIAFLAVSSIILLGNEMTDQQKISSVREQLDVIGNQIANVVSVSNVLNDASVVSVELDIPKINVLGEKNPESCNIDISGGLITLSYEMFDQETGNVLETVTVEKGYVEPTGLQVPRSIQCGEKLEITED